MFLTGNRNIDITILNQLGDRDLGNALQTNQEADLIGKGNTLWSERIAIKFPYLSPEIKSLYKGSRSWSRYYRSLTRQAPDKMKFAYNTDRWDLIMVELEERGITGYITMRNLVEAAISKNKLSMLKYLIKKGGIISNPFYLRKSSWLGNIEVVKYILGNTNPDQLTLNMSLNRAIEGNHEEVIRFLISMGAKVTNSSLKFASYNGNTELVEYIMNTTNISKDFIIEAIEWASEVKHEEVVVYLQKFI